MGESNGDWADLPDDETKEAWDGYERLPEPGVNDAIDTFCETKQITVPALIRIGARLSEHNVLAFAFPGGLKYRNVETGQRWNNPGAEFTELKVVRAGAPSDTVIIAEGETDAARLTLLYPTVDVAVLPAGAKRFTQAFADQLDGYARVLVGLDNDTVPGPDGKYAGEEGWKKVHALLPQAIRFAPPGVNDWCDLIGDPPALPAALELVRVGPVVFESLADEVERGLPDPEILVDDLLYAEGVHLFSGAPGSGKTTVVMHAAVMVMAEGRPVVWLDYEMGRRRTARKLSDMSIAPALLREHFNYAWAPLEAEKHLLAMGQRFPGALVVIDSFSKALSAAGINENANDEVTPWTTQVIDACLAGGMAVAIIDHIAKTGGGSDYSRGAGAKHADTDVHWRVNKHENFKVDTVGLVELSATKDRDGFFPDSTWWRVGDGQGNLTLEPLEGKPDPDDPAEPGI